MRIWLLICASEMFCCDVLWTTCTTTLIVRTLGTAAAKPRADSTSAKFSISERFLAYSGSVLSNRRCTSLVAQYRRGASAMPCLLGRSPACSRPHPGRGAARKVPEYACDVSDLPHELFQHWTHSHEEDSGDVQV